MRRPIVGVAAEVRAEAGRRAWSQSELARRAGMPVTTVRRYFYAEDRAMTLGAFALVADALGLSPSELMRRAEANGAREDTQSG